MEPGTSRIEKMLGITFTSDPRNSRIPLPKPRGNVSDKKPYPFPPQKVTPAMAKDWLQHRIIRPEFTPKELKHSEFRPNRRFVLPALTGTKYAKGLVQIIEDGEWDSGISQGIAFTPDGYISDGQHRLAAIVLANKAVEVIITVNASWSAFDVTDAGRARTAGQLLGDMPYGDFAASIARHLLPVITGKHLDEFYSRESSKTDVGDMVRAWPLFHGPWLNEIQLAYKDSGVPRAPLGAAVLAALAAGAPADDVQKFLNGLRLHHKDGYITIGTNGEDPRLLMRRLFTGKNKGRLTDEIQYGNCGVLRRAMEIWLERNSAKPIKVSTLGRTPARRQLPDFWNSEAIVEYHESKFS